MGYEDGNFKRPEYIYRTFALPHPFDDEEDTWFQYALSSCGPSPYPGFPQPKGRGVVIQYANYDNFSYQFGDDVCGFNVELFFNPPLQMFSRIVEFKGDGSFNFGIQAGIGESELWTWKYRYQILSFPQGKIDKRVGNPSLYRFGYINPTNFGSSLESRQVNFVLGEGTYFDAFYSWEGQDPSGDINVSFPLSRPVANGLSWSLKPGVIGILSVRGIKLYDDLNGYL